MANGQEILDAHVELQHELDAARKDLDRASAKFAEVKGRVLEFRERYKNVLKLFAIAQVSKNTTIQIEPPKGFWARFFRR